MAKPRNFRDQIRHNKRATIRLFVVVFLILAAMVWGIGLYLNTPPIATTVVAVIVGLIYLAVTSRFSVPAILKSARARPVNMKVREEKLLAYKVEEMALAAGLPAPKVYVTPSRDINAFATGKKPEEGVIAVTRGALEQLDAEELEGVLAHEMSHIANYDIRISTYVIAMVGLIAMIGEIMIRSLFFGGMRNRGSNNNGGAMLVMLAVVIVFAILAPIFSRMAHLAISRKREYLADATGVQFTRNPEGLARALEKIGRTEPTEKHSGDKTVASLYISNPFKRVRKESLWSTHPPIDERIERLRNM